MFRGIAALVFHFLFYPESTDAIAGNNISMEIETKMKTLYDYVKLIVNLIGKLFEQEDYDDINIASFIEVLRNDFPTKQIILSTHETNEENYILYKFSKYNLKDQSLNVKDKIY